MKRHAAREKAFQILFQIDMNQIDPHQAIEDFLQSDQKDAYLYSVVEGVVHHKEQIDAIISENMVNWSINRIASVEKTILRVATYEMKFLEDIPTNVSINEAVELAHAYGDEKSGKFVNGVLSKIV
ncbi:MAG TPA: transcription antitermination factor NusB [Bacillota bacterium]|nr:transcription antitermination factor NusB [Bacillota bacterium]